LLTVIGAPHMFCDGWVRAESDAKRLGFLVDLAITEKSELNEIEAEHREVTERSRAPDIANVRERPRSRVQESARMRSRFKENCDRAPFKMDLGNVTETGADARDQQRALGDSGAAIRHSTDRRR
jgi:hypothetical protein